MLVRCVSRVLTGCVVRMCNLADNAASPCSDNGTLQSSHTDVIVNRSGQGFMPLLDEGGYWLVGLLEGVVVWELRPLSMEK